MVFGDLQAENALESILQANRDPGFEDENANVGVGLFVGSEGPESIRV
jgi:hypothetical protein